MLGTIVGPRRWRSDDGVVLPFVDDRGTIRIGGVLRPRPNFGAVKGWKAAGLPIVPRAQWEERDYTTFKAPILDQAQTASCTGHGTATAMARAWQMAGHAPRAFSACYIYGKINGGLDQGAIVSDAATQLLAGVCTETTVPEGMIYARQFPPGADAEAARFRAEDCYHLGTYDEIVSALMYGWLPVFGILVGDDFGNLDADGVSPVGGDSGHCLTGAGLKFTRSRAMAVETQNSWGPAWGDSGFTRLIEGHFTFGMNYMGGLDAFAIRATLDDPADPTNPPPVIA